MTLYVVFSVENEEKNATESADVRKNENSKATRVAIVRYYSAFARNRSMAQCV
jgi:hypothetical protein